MPSFHPGMGPLGVCKAPPHTEEAKRAWRTGYLSSLSCSVCSEKGGGKGGGKEGKREDRIDQKGYERRELGRPVMWLS